MLDSLFGGVAGGIVGAVGGVITGIANAVTQYKLKKLEYAHEKEMAEQDRLTLQTEANAAVQISEQEAKRAEAQLDGEAYIVSQKAGAKELFKGSYLALLFGVETNWKHLTIPIGAILALLFGLIEGARKSMRVGLTLFYTWLLFKVWGQSSDQGQSEQAICFLTVSSVTWWFADRATNKILQKIWTKKMGVA